jgi:hypothetical protein
VYPREISYECMKRIELVCTYLSHVIQRNWLVLPSFVIWPSYISVNHPTVKIMSLVRN